MNDCVSRDTAILLRDAGFKCNGISICQVFYNDIGLASVIVKELNDPYVEIRRREFTTTASQSEPHWRACSLIDGSVGNDFSESEINQNCVFAPTATDILKELGNGAIIQRIGGSFCVFNGAREMFDSSKQPKLCESPAEAAALAWLAQKENK